MTRDDLAGSVWVRAGGVLAAWIALLFVENVAVGLGWRSLFAGAWETASARTLVSPIALAMLVPFAFVAVGVARLAESNRGAVAGLAAVAGGLVAYGVSFGRHLASWLVRAPFILVVAGASALIAWSLTPRVLRASRARPSLVALAGVLVAVLAWCANAFVLPRLYLAFHAALLAITLASSALASLVLVPRDDEPSRAPTFVAVVTLLVGALSLAWTPSAARRLASADNLRLVLVEHAPVLGRAVELSSILAPPALLDEAPADADSMPGEIARALDWTGKDVLLITVDALRADHVGVYGYARPTTPHLDALAKEGTVFTSAYCPTPHTSYSIASLMAGKYMRPLLAVGLGADSETWAAMMRRYGYRTAGFYPPAVFFIDADRFQPMRDRGLDFEYRKEEFATPELRASQVHAYLDATSDDKPIFLWVHFFEPHEPYVVHDAHVFGDSDLDRYDGEIAAADDGIGAIVSAVRAKRPSAIVIVTADHGEEFGEHGGRYHGTTVYEEQVRVPLVVAGPGVAKGTIASVVQTIDLLPTTISALGIPRPARLRGRDLGPLLARKADAVSDPGRAFAETDAYTLYASGPSRLVCERRAAACALYDVSADPSETKDVTPSDPARAKQLRRAMTAIASEHGRFESGEATAWPEALRRGIAGDADAAEDVAALVDDASKIVRAKAAEVCFDLHVASTAPSMRRALASSELHQDDEVKRWAALTLVRMGEAATPLAEDLARDPDAKWRRVAALAFAERGDARGAGELAAWWSDRASLEFTRQVEIVRAMAKVRDRAAVPALAASLDDVRLRAEIADALGAIGDAHATSALRDAFAHEAYANARQSEARALTALGDAAWLARQSVPDAGPDAMPR